MHHPEQDVVEILKKAGIDFTATLPCDRTKNLLPLVMDAFKNVQVTREEDGLGICAGAWLAGSRPIMIIQSTGLGNMVNALASLNQASAVPIPVLASYRGFYKEGIDSQMPLGRHLPGILKGCEIPFTLIDEPEKISMIAEVIKDAFDHHRPHIALVSPKVWEGSDCSAWQDNPPLMHQPETDREPTDLSPLPPIPAPSLTRHDAFKGLAGLLDQQALVCNLGIPAKELYEIKDRPLNYYMLGSMGLASSIGLGMALSTERKVMVLDGDGSILMNPNAQVTIGRYQPDNLMILALDNGVYGSTGSQNTYTQSGIDLISLARACGFRHTVRVSDIPGIQDAVRDMADRPGSSFIHVILKPGNAPRPNIPLQPEEITRRFRDYLKN